MNKIQVDNKKLKLLLVDDEVEILEIQQTILSDLGYEVVIASSFDQAAEIGKSFDQFFLVISDYNMPGKTGLELCEYVRKYSNDVPFIILTGFADKQMAIRGLQTGLTEILEKPIAQDQFELVIAGYAQKYLDKLEIQRKEMQEIASFFVDEAKELYNDLDETILRLKEVPLDYLIVDVLFRKIHSVKGGSSAIPGAELLSKLSHAFESSLAKIKNDRFSPSEELILVYLDASAVSRQLLDLLLHDPQKMSDFNTQIDQIILQLQGAVSAEVSKQNKSTDKNQASITSSGKQQVKDDVDFVDEEIMVKNSQLDHLMGMIGELVILKNYYHQMSNDLILKLNDRKIQNRVENFSRSMEKSTHHLQEQILEIRKVPLKKLTGKITRLVHQSAKMCNKKIKFEIIGDEFNVDKSISTAIGTCLTHMVRNSIDHGIETPEERTSKGKSAEGHLEVKYAEVKGSIEVLIKDDGRGLNIAKIKQKAIERGLISEQQSQTMSDTELSQMIFLPGFSTAEKVTDVSGRGVGMDAALSMVERLSGKIQIDSTGPQGTLFKIKIPFLKTVSVEDCMIVEVDHLHYAIPVETIRFVRKGLDVQVCDVNGQMVAVFEDGSLPMLTLSKEMGVHGDFSKSDLKKKNIVTISSGHFKYALIVDRILYQTEAVTQQLPQALNCEIFVLGSTILGDDQIAYVLEMQELYKTHVQKMTIDKVSISIAS